MGVLEDLKGAEAGSLGSSESKVVSDSLDQMMKDHRLKTAPPPHCPEATAGRNRQASCVASVTVAMCPEK